MGISIQAHSRAVYNGVRFVGCGYKEFNEVYNIPHKCSMKFKSGEHTS